MAIKGEWIRYEDQTGYFAVPDRAAEPLPAVVVIQEVMGVNEHIEDVTRRIAAAGYAALAPDLFAVGGARPAPLTRERIAESMAFGARLPPGAAFDPARRQEALAKLPEAERIRISETYQQMFGSAAPGRMETLVAPLKTAVRHLLTRQKETRGQRVGCVGFCMGGGLSALLACEEEDLSCAAVYYGNTPAPEKIAKVHCPVIAFYGAADQRVNAGIPTFQEGMKKAGKPCEHHIYEGAGHAFFNDSAPSYNVKAARDSFSRLLAFLLKNLSG